MPKPNELNEVIKQCVIPTPPEGDLVTWLHGHTQGMAYLLAQTLTGVVWGKVEAGLLRFPPEGIQLTEQNVLGLRLFGADKELLLWRDGGRLHSRVWTHKPEVDSYKQEYILWGTAGTAVDALFTHVIDGQQDLSHTPPVPPFPDTRTRPLRLHVRHTLAADPDTGLAVIVASCLTDLLSTQLTEE